VKLTPPILLLKIIFIFRESIDTVQESAKINQTADESNNSQSIDSSTSSSIKEQLKRRTHFDGHPQLKNLKDLPSI
jgi:hypothetical protein